MKPVVAFWTAVVVGTCLMPAGARRASARPFTVAVGGDVLLGRGVKQRAKRSGWKGLLSGAAKTLRAADLAIVNLESPLARCLPGSTVRRPRLCGDPKGIAALKAAGVTAVTLANNHGLDAGRFGLRKTARLLRRAGIVPLGVHAAMTGRPRPERLGPLTVVAANLTRTVHAPGAKVPIPSPSAVARAVKKARGRPVLVILHGGRELYPHPNPRDRRYARAAVLAGASAVAMHGAHVIRPLVRHRAVPVHLGLGNLLFDQRNPLARKGAIVTLRFSGAGPARVKGTRFVTVQR